MRITEEQRAILDYLVCERLSRNSSNMREIDSFFNSKNEKLVERLLNEAYSEDEDLVNYYKTWLKFESSQERSAATPVYDLTCKFLYQDTCSLKEKRSYFYDHFNPEEDAV